MYKQFTTPTGTRVCYAKLHGENILKYQNYNFTRTFKFEEKIRRQKYTVKLPR